MQYAASPALGAGGAVSCSVQPVCARALIFFILIALQNGWGLAFRNRAQQHTPPAPFEPAQPHAHSHFQCVRPIIVCAVREIEQLLDKPPLHRVLRVKKHTAVFNKREQCAFNAALFVLAVRDWL